MDDHRSTEKIAEDVEERRVATRDEATSARENLAEHVEDRRIATADEASRQRDSLATKLAYDAGMEAARLDARLQGHDEHLGRINGSIDKSVAVQEKLFDGIIDLRTEMERRFDVQASAEAQAKKILLDSRRDSRKQVLQIVGTVFVATIGAAATIIVALVSTTPG